MTDTPSTGAANGLRESFPRWFVVPAGTVLLAVAVLLIIRAATTGISELDLLIASIAIFAVALTLIAHGLTLPLRRFIRARRAAKRDGTHAPDKSAEKSHPLRAAVIAAILLLVLMTVVAGLAATYPSASPRGLNITAAALTLLGLVGLFVSDLIRMWQKEDGPQEYDAKVSNAAEVWRTAGHGAVIVAAALFVAAHFLR